MIKRTSKVSQSSLNELRDFCKSLIPKMLLDVSRYAPNRRRIWLFHECNLQNTQLKLGYFDQRLYDFCKRVYPQANVGLMSFGSNSKVNNFSSDGLIALHRDQTFAMPIAKTINLGSCIFQYDLDRQKGKLKSFELQDGEIIEFNCKHLHAVTKITSDLRISLNLWQLNESKGYKPLF